MTKRYLPLRAGEVEVRLRLTMASQRALRQAWGEDMLQGLFTAAAEPDKLCQLLTQALTWPGSENPITDGEVLYDALVDDGWEGQAAFAGLVFDLGAASGLLTGEQAKNLTETVKTAFTQAFAALGEHD